MKVGLLFGSFNPIHTGHLILANYMATNTDLDTVWLVVSPQNPFKPSNTLLHEFDRLQMVTLAIADNPNLNVSNIEFSMPRPSYTIDTLTYLQDKYPSYEFVLLMGEDNLPLFPKWKNADRILEYHRVYIYPRSGSVTVALPEMPNVTFVKAPILDISATFIRNCIREEKDIKYLVPDEVADYIKVHKLYR
ncbi:nicotinate (nicotinamide) nucleotide adenylyltransferase [Pontibacter liquoris]|uniref:nicotinate (nicotinamide) nucleotide adenylyltransferase n=1 Tax=Pontibacter liquoris TaxID=2905677 RepID=UPI001FA757E6|nr:nicotinate (nicotinamide) nucleotide adenylyltransferase [Pontibacter liquoris]